MHRSMDEDLQAFCEDVGEEGILELRRVALTPEQIYTLGVEPQPEPVEPKGHGLAFIEEGLEPAAQLEALEPNVLTDVCTYLLTSAFI